MSQQVLTVAKIWIPESFNRDDGYLLIDQWNLMRISQWATGLMWRGWTSSRDSLPPLWMTCEEVM